MIDRNKATKHATWIEKKKQKPDTQQIKVLKLTTDRNKATNPDT